MSRNGFSRLFITVPVGVLLIAVVIMGLKFAAPDKIEAQEQVAVSIQYEETSHQNEATVLHVQEAAGDSTLRDDAMLDSHSQKDGKNVPSH